MKKKVLLEEEMFGTNQPTAENEGEEARQVTDGDLECSQPKSSRRTPKMKAVKLKPAVAELVAGFSRTPSRSAGTKEKGKREEMAAIVLEKRRVLVAQQFTVPEIEPSTHGEHTLDLRCQLVVQALQEREADDSRRNSVKKHGTLACTAVVIVSVHVC